MFDKNDLKNRVVEKKESNSPSKRELSGLTVHELIALRAEIDTFLPSMSMSDMNMEQELLLQFQQTKTLLNTILTDEEVPANQKAQVINTCNAILTEITKTQSSLYNAERLKIMEQCLTNALKSAPTEVSDKFFESYERELKILEK
jgi:uncharacterized protein (UPF0147 family)